MSTINSKNENGTEKVTIKKDYGDYLIICQYGTSSTGVQITPEIAVLIIQKLSEYLLEQNQK